MRRRYFLVFYTPALLITFILALMSRPVVPRLTGAWAKLMVGELSRETILIIGNNLFIASLLWALTIITLFLAIKRRRSYDAGVLLSQIIFLVYLAFFVKESAGVLLTLLDFQQTMQVPSIIAFLTLILPHGLFEYTAFVLIAVYGMEWFRANFDRDIVELPWHEIALSFLLIVLAGIVETGITPYVFRTYLMNIG